MTKLCKSCGIEKSLNSFYKEKKNKDGLKGCCSNCFKQSRKGYESNRRSDFSSLYLDPSFMSELKTCISCDVEKNRTNFNKRVQHKDGHSPYCKNCATERELKNRLENVEEWRENHRKNQAAWRSQNKEKAAASKKKWKKSRRARDPIFRLQESLRARIRLVLAGKCKSKSSFQLLGCDLETYKSYLENQFTEGMSWDNYGEWEIDHIEPCCSFDLTLPENQLICFNYKNTKPLWRAENLAKAKEDVKKSISRVKNS